MWSKAEIFRNKIIVSLLFIDAFLFYFFDKQPDYVGFSLSFLISISFVGIAAYYHYKRAEPKIAKAFKATSHLVLYTALGSIFNHLLVLTNRPTIDSALTAIDSTFGFYWPEFIEMAQNIPLLDTLSSFAYNSSLPQIAFVVLVLSFSGRFERLDNVLNAFVISSLITIVFWALFPSFGSYVHYSLTNEVSEIPGLVVNKENVELILQYRSGDWDTLWVDKLTGLIALPSFHTVMAVLTIYACWGVRFIAWPVFALNMLVLISVPIDGGHHLVDVFAGVMVAVFVITLVEGKAHSLQSMFSKQKDLQSLGR
ncbi:phosphatase PAP2 family protein [Pseudovibrio brasiliensis]|uniref:Phosphatase PAP2 family protein n=1 Tax=Pseudovibrio brasiliensis TaxID=1898042 RepID=A0ABX8AV40_9HYPH|nr:phosphatase PAP2 family protein [Pseudovibrio brasiliensis]QUS58954.1 phosphatase PAP2 family protein [Pseudovibrio brasiliensis]